MTLPCGTLTRIFLHVVVVGLVFLGRQYLVDPVHFFGNAGLDIVNVYVHTYLYTDIHIVKYV